MKKSTPKWTGLPIWDLEPHLPVSRKNMKNANLCFIVYGKIMTQKYPKWIPNISQRAFEKLAKFKHIFRSGGVQGTGSPPDMAAEPPRAPEAREAAPFQAANSSSSSSSSSDGLSVGDALRNVPDCS